MVHTVFAALISCVCGEIKHIPNMGCPKIWTSGNLLDKLFVIISLIFLGIIALNRLCAVPIECLATVLADADCLVWIFFMKIVKPSAIHIDRAAVPSEIVIV